MEEVEVLFWSNDSDADQIVLLNHSLNHLLHLSKVRIFICETSIGSSQ